MPPPNDNRIYSATYSNVPVYELNVAGNHVMRRRSDDWINATHILKVADFDKPARTRILEREVQKGVHEKVQGGYGKYQGTWIPLHDGRHLAERNGVLEKLRPILDFVPGDRSPPPAPKHATATSSKPRRQPVAQRRAPGTSLATLLAEKKPQQPTNVTSSSIIDVATVLQHINEDFEHPMESETPDNVTIASESFVVDDYADGSQYTNSRKRKRNDHVLSLADQQHQLWADELLDYFMLLESPDPFHHPPTPPPAIDLNRPIDDKGHTALHWAAAMGDLNVVKDLIHRGADIAATSNNGETPLMRAVIFTNNFDKNSMERLAGLLVPTVTHTEWFGSTVFHHIAATTSSKSKYACARYYLDCILNKMAEMYTPQDVERMLNIQDRNGDTAVTIAARNGARKCVRSLIGRNAAVDLPNDLGETADELIVQLNHRRRERGNRAMSSSPFQMDPLLANGSVLDPTNPLGASQTALAKEHKSEAAATLTQQIFPLLLSKSEKLALTFDAELAERESEVVEAERVAQMRKDEIEILKRQSMDLAINDHEDEFDTRLEAELEVLVEECEGFIEEEQLEELERLVELERSKATGHSQDGMGMHGDEGHSREKLALLRKLRDLQQERIRLVREVVENQSAAGLGERQADYRRLITGALGVREEDVEGMLPEIVAELEEYQGMESSVA
ncbi:hypothetical protein MBLNU459_g0606t1 [Dothideomycetes sp. NU459]